MSGINLLKEKIRRIKIEIREGEKALINKKAYYEGLLDAVRIAQGEGQCKESNQSLYNFDPYDVSQELDK